MKRFALILFLAALPLAAQEKIAVIGLNHSHVWGHLGKMVTGDVASFATSPVTWERW